MRKASLQLALTAIVAVPVLVVVACSNYGDGERCDSRGVNGGNDDCKSGLLCTTGAMRGDPQGIDLCCPPDLASSTSADCRGTRSIIVLPEASVADTGASDSASSTNDASSSSDAGSGDAATEGG